jgi:hypothetical protein
MQASSTTWGWARQNRVCCSRDEVSSEWIRPYTSARSPKLGRLIAPPGYRPRSRASVRLRKTSCESVYGTGRGAHRRQGMHCSSTVARDPGSGPPDLVSVRWMACPRSGSRLWCGASVMGSTRSRSRLGQEVAVVLAAMR